MKHLGRILSVASARRLSSGAQLHGAIENVSALLEANDRSSYLLAQYIPEPARNAFLAVRGFGLEVNKISDGGANSGARAARALSQLSSSLGISTADMKFKFWSDKLSDVFSGRGTVNEPTMVLLRDALENNLNLDISYFQQFLQTRRHFLLSGLFANTEAICSYGEGTYSQMNYATQAVLLSPSISPLVVRLLEISPKLQSHVGDIAAHIGQLTAVSSMILGLLYYASTRNQVTLPTDLMTKFELSQEDFLRLAQGHLSDAAQAAEVREKLQNVVFETAVTANDHMLAARSKLDQLRREISEVLQARPNDELMRKNSRKWRRGIPDVIFTPFMVSLPTLLYLEKLGKHDFDLLSEKLKRKEWRLAWRSFRSYYKREI